MAKLVSALFAGDPIFEACATRDEAHIVPGARGLHVAKIQHALAGIESIVCDASELNAGSYGASTAAGVLAYKTKRGIVNRAYQTAADNIVGRMTIEHLDADMAAVEQRMRIRAALSR